MFLLVLGGCNESIVEMPDMVVSTKEATYKVGKAVTFQLEGNPDFIYFYSGEVGKRYEFAKRISASGIPQLQFTSLRVNGTQAGSLRLMVSQDFQGITVGDAAATVTKITSATWTDITDKAILSSGSNTSSGVIDLSEFAKLGKPVFIAFKYLAQAGSLQNKWTISGLTVKNALTDGTAYTLANHTGTVITNYGVTLTSSPGWVSFSVINSYAWALSTSNMVITGATTVANATNHAEAWALMGPVELTAVTPDVATHLKGLGTRLNSYSYTYNTAGTYAATFVGANNSISGGKEVIKTSYLTIVP